MTSEFSRYNHGLVVGFPSVTTDFQANHGLVHDDRFFMITTVWLSVLPHVLLIIRINYVNHGLVVGFASCDNRLSG